MSRKYYCRVAQMLDALKDHVFERPISFDIQQQFATHKQTFFNISDTVLVPNSFFEIKSCHVKLSIPY